MNRSPVVLGIDAGTSGVKALLVDASGSVIAAHTTPLELAAPQPGWAEQDPQQWWDAARWSVRRVLDGQDARRVFALGIAGQMHSSVFLDKAGDSHIWWNDNKNRYDFLTGARPTWTRKLSDPDT